MSVCIGAFESGLENTQGSSMDCRDLKAAGGRLIQWTSETWILLPSLLQVPPV